MSEIIKAPGQGADVVKEKRKITPRARRIALEQGVSLDQIPMAGTGYDGGVCEKDMLRYLAELPAEAKIKASPLAKRIAEEAGLDISQVQGTGANEKVMRRDVETALSAVAPKQKTEQASPQDDAPSQERFSPDGKEILWEVPYEGVRRIIGERLSESMFTAPHVYFMQKVNLEKLLELRVQINQAQPQKVSVTDFIAKAVVTALGKYPEMNSSLIGDKIVRYKTVNLGIAVAAPTGLIVPTVKRAEQMGVVQIAETSKALIEKARDGKLTPDDYSGGTFTISNLGMFGVDCFTAIINPPETGILGISATKDEPVVVTNPDGIKEITIKPMMSIQLSADHRVVDGLLGAQFITEIAGLLENPILLML